jgi:hypothetical protein
MTRVVLITHNATYRGELDLSSGVSGGLRFLDALNTPQRLRHGASRASPSLLIEKGVRYPRAGGTATPCCEQLVLRPAEVVAAYEEAESTAGGGEAAKAAVYEKRQERGGTKMLLHTANGLRLEGFVPGGSQNLEMAKTGRTFIPCTEVLVVDLEVEQPPLFIPFLAVNLLQVESYGTL